MPDKGKRQDEVGPDLDELDRLILNEIQSHFPLEPRPYRVLAEKLDRSEDEVMQRIQDMKDRQIIRRLGANFNSRKLGYTSTLCAARVKPEQTDRFAAMVNGYSGVTHNYRRDHHYNIWFTLIAPSKQEIERILSEIREESGVSEIISLPAERIFKIQVDFEM